MGGRFGLARVFLGNPRVLDRRIVDQLDRVVCRLSRLFDMGNHHDLGERVPETVQEQKHVGPALRPLRSLMSCDSAIRMASAATSSVPPEICIPTFTFSACLMRPRSISFAELRLRRAASTRFRSFVILLSTSKRASSS